MNGNYTPQKKTLSVAAIIGMIGAMLFSIAAACMIFLPMTATPGVNNAPNGFDMSVIGTQGQQFMNIWGQVASRLGEAPGDYQFYYIASFIMVLSVTVAFFGLIFCALMVVLGRALPYLSIRFCMDLHFHRLCSEVRSGYNYCDRHRSDTYVLILICYPDLLLHRSQR